MMNNGFFSDTAAVTNAVDDQVCVTDIISKRAHGDKIFLLNVSDKFLGRTKKFALTSCLTSGVLPEPARCHEPEFVQNGKPILGIEVRNNRGIFPRLAAFEPDIFRHQSEKKARMLPSALIP